MALAAQRRGQMSRDPETCQEQHQATKRWPDPDLGRQDTPHDRPTSVHALGTGQPLLTPLLYQALLWRWGRDRPCARQKSRLCISQVRPPGGGSAPRPTPREGRKQPSCQPVAAPPASSKNSLGAGGKAEGAEEV